MMIAVYLLLPVFIMAALFFAAGLALYRTGGNWKWFGATLMASAVVVAVFWIIFIPV